MAGLKALKTLKSEDREVSKFMAYVQQAWAQLLGVAVIDGVLLTDIVLVSGVETAVEHKLGRKPLGWTVVGKNANANVWDSQASNNLPSKTIILNCSANVTISLWVF